MANDAFLSLAIVLAIFSVLLCFTPKETLSEKIYDFGTERRIHISSELTILTEKLCFIWTSTRDAKLRKYNLPNYKHRYGLEFQITRKSSHVVLLILLAGDIATNPGPGKGCRTTENSTSLGLNVLYLNTRSLKAIVAQTDYPSAKICKISLFQHLVYSGDYDVVCVCETWLNDSVLNSEILSNYGTIFRRDRVNRTGGGVLVAVKAGIQVTRRYDLEPDNTELVVIELMKSNVKPVTLYTFYRPPDSVPDVLQQLNDSIQTTTESTRIVMVGDFNLPSVKWSSDESVPVNTGGPAENETFCDLVDDNFLQQFILGPTHTAGHKLDLLLCNSPEIIGDVSTFHPETCDYPTDHYIVEFKVKLRIKRAQPIKRLVFDYKNGNFNELRNFLTRFPINVTPSDNIDDDWQQWKDIFQTAVETYIPMRIVKDTNSPPWIDKDVRTLIRKKYQALKKYRINKSADRKRKLRSVSQQIKYLIRSKHREYLAKIENSFFDNPKLFWSYHKAITHCRSSQSSEITYNGATAKTAKEKANLFNTYFSSVFRPPSTTRVHPPRMASEGNISEITLDVHEVTQGLRNLNTLKACGPDGIPPRLLQECAFEIAPSICELFNHSLHTGQIPSEWKSANVTPVHKKDLKKPAEHYRPISLLPILGKVLERCVCVRLYDHVRNLITNSQHGFLRRRSCVTQLLSVLHAIGQSLDKNIQTDVVYLDFAKAFDTVDHQILLHKLASYGVSGHLYEWFTNYLSGRRQRVVVDGATSQWAPVTSGVPQGSILGPVLFAIFINDLPDALPVDTSAALYADDTKLYKFITSIDDCENLQHALTDLNCWGHENNLLFNQSKCKVLTITRKKSPLTYNYHMDSKDLTRVQREKDLGVLMNNILSWDDHVYSVTAKGNKMLGLLKRTCPQLTNTIVRRTLYLTLVKSQLSYATEVWSPPTIKLRSRVESLQRRATLWILKSKRGEMSYKQRLATLDLLPLCYEREIKDLVLFFKALYGQIDLDVHNFVSFVNNGRTRLSQNPSLTLKVPLCKSRTFQFSYFNRLVKLWNHLCKVFPSTSFSSLSSFKRTLKDTYRNLLVSTFDIDMSCTWTLVRDCPCHRT